MKKLKLGAIYVGWKVRRFGIYTIGSFNDAFSLSYEEFRGSGGD